MNNECWECMRISSMVAQLINYKEQKSILSSSDVDGEDRFVEMAKATYCAGEGNYKLLFKWM